MPPTHSGDVCSINTVTVILVLFVRSRRDGYESVFGRGSFPRDPYPQWRCVQWSPDSTMVACSRSGGAVDIFDIVGTLLFTIPSVSFNVFNLLLKVKGVWLVSDLSLSAFL